MAHHIACRLPSINLLSLDLPLPSPHFQNRQYDLLPHLVPRQYGAPVAWSPIVPAAPAYSAPAPTAHAAGLSSLAAASALSAGPRTPASPAALKYQLPEAEAPGSVPGPVPVCAPMPAANAATPAVKAETPNPPRCAELPALSTCDLAESSNPAKEWKPRKKRQCPECHLYFSNLATHKSTHLKPTSRPHVCKICHRGFARPNDLFRHFKCHWKEIGADNGQFRCPFKNGPRGDHCCHSLGIFSRCDTYKNHLKAIHFQYPGGTKKSQRNLVAGSCRLCQAHFSNVDEWISTHIDTHKCPYSVA